jgi:RHS repeat-associated protein
VKTYIYPDVLGSTAATSNVSGTVTYRMRFAPFGLAWGHTAENEIAYTGHKFDTDTGLNYMQARYYDPLIGRFYSNDPIGVRDVHSFNRYAYANNNPFSYVDPTGRSSVIGACGNSDTLCLDSGSSPSPTDSGGWEKSGTTTDGVDRYSYKQNPTGMSQAATLVIGRAASAAGSIPTWAKSPLGIVLLSMMPTRMGDGTLHYSSPQFKQCLPYCTLADGTEVPV